MSKEELEAKIKANEIQIKRLYNENIDLEDAINISGNYTEKEEVWTYGKGKTKRTEAHLVGRTRWTEKFKDEDSGEFFDIERSKICRVDGRPADVGGFIEKYDIPAEEPLIAISTEIRTYTDQAINEVLMHLKNEVCMMDEVGKPEVKKIISKYVRYTPQSYFPS